MVALATRGSSVADPLKRAALVVRVSTERQARTEEGSLTNQLQRLRQHIAYKRDACGELWEETATYELRAISGKHSLRSVEFGRLFADIRSGRINTILCTALDRICRSVADFLSFFEILNQHGVEFVCLKQHYDTTTPQGKLFVTIMMALAEFEREQTADRTREATHARSERGLFNGGKLLGYDPDPVHRARLVVNEDEAAVVQAAFQLYRDCGSLKETAEGLNARGYRTKRYTAKNGTEHPGTPFRLNTVQYLLKNVAYIGKKEVHRESKGKDVAAGKAYRLVDAVWPGIIEPELFEEVRSLMAANGRSHHNGALPVRHIYLLSGLVACGRCSGPLEGRSGTGRKGTVYFYYACKSTKCGLRASASEIEDAVLQRITFLSKDSNLVAQLVEETNARLRRRLPPLARQQRLLSRQLAEVKGQASKLLGDWATREDGPSKEFVTDQLNGLGQRRAELEKGLSEAEEQLARLKADGVTAKAVQAALSQVHELYAALQPHEQKELVSLVVRKVTVSDREIGLEINGGVCQLMAETPSKTLSGGWFSQPPVRLPELVAESVICDTFPVHIRSLTHLVQSGIAERVAAGVEGTAREWQALLDSGAVKNRAALARQLGLTRARVTQVLGPVERQ